MLYPAELRAPARAIAARMHGRQARWAALGLGLVVLSAGGAGAQGLLLADGRTAAAAVGYRQLLAVIGGDWNEEQGWAEAERATRALARRQRTYFRRDPRLRWVAWNEDPDRRFEAVHEALEQP